MKYLFLDIDGVLNHEDWYKKIRSEKCIIPYIFECFDPRCVKRVNEILEETEAELVVSSSWRLDSDLQHTFSIVGLPTKFKKTPSFKEGCIRYKCRGEEIEAFLKNYPCDNYAILDDDNDMLSSQKRHFIRTACDNTDKVLVEKNEGTGLTEKVKRDIINLLNN